MNQGQMENKTEEVRQNKSNRRFFIQKSENSELSVCNSEINIEVKSKEAMFSRESSTSNFGEGGSDSLPGNQNWLQHKRREDTDSESSLSPQERGRFNVGRWTDNEHKKFLEAIMKYGNEWKKVQHYISTRSSTQARSHAQKFFLRLKKSIKVSGGLEETGGDYVHPNERKSKLDLNLNLVTAENHKYDSILKFLTDYSKQGQIELGRLSLEDSNSLSEEQRQKLINIVLNFTRNCSRTKISKNTNPHKTKRKLRKNSSDEDIEEQQSNYNSQDYSEEKNLFGEDDVKLFKTKHKQFLEANESIQNSKREFKENDKNLIFVITKVKRTDSECNSFAELDELSYHNNRGMRKVSSLSSPLNERVLQHKIKERKFQMKEDIYNSATNNDLLNNFSDSKSRFASKQSISPLAYCKAPLPSERIASLYFKDESSFGILSETLNKYTSNVPRQEPLNENNFYRQESMQYPYKKLDTSNFQLRFSDSPIDRRNVYDELKCFFNEKRKSSENKSFTRDDSRTSSRKESKIYQFSNQEEIFSDKNLIPEKKVESEENPINPFFIHFDIEYDSTQNENPLLSYGESTAVEYDRTDIIL